MLLPAVGGRNIHGLSLLPRSGMPKVPSTMQKVDIKWVLLPTVGGRNIHGLSLLPKSGMPKVSSFGSLPRTLSDHTLSKRSIDGESPRGGTLGQPFHSQVDKAESIASTAVRTADKIKVCLLLLMKLLVHSGCNLHCCQDSSQDQGVFAAVDEAVGASFRVQLALLSGQLRRSSLRLVCGSSFLPCCMLKLFLDSECSLHCCHRVKSVFSHPTICFAMAIACISAVLPCW